MVYLLISHTHWDREWYRTFQSFRARLVDTLDSALDLIQADPGYKFLFDGQSVVLEDYLEIRPHRRGEIERAVAAGRVAIGPWYVQPDSLLPSGESHVRNLLEGRRVAEEVGPASRIAYTPDSFGHPSQFPQIFSGFGLTAFVYWRGNGNEMDALPAEYSWVAPDGSEIMACHLYKGYGPAAVLPRNVEEAVERLLPLVKELEARTRSGRVLLMNGSDHLLPDPHTKEVAEALAGATGARVVRGLLEDFVEGIEVELPRFSGELIGGKVANLLPGVWSTRTPIKIRNRRCQTLLETWAEPWAALGRALSAPDERPALRLAWGQLLQNQAHDSICGCSQDSVHDQMQARYDTAEEIARETAARLLERIAGLGPERRAPWTNEVELAVFNPSPHPRTDVVRFALEGYPPFGFGGEDEFVIHPLLLQNLGPDGFLVDGKPARLFPSGAGKRLRLVPHQHDWEIEFVAEDVPAFGYRRFKLEPAKTEGETADSGSSIETGEISVEAESDGSLTLRFGDRVFDELCTLEDTGDRGDSYDFDPIAPGPSDFALTSVEVKRFQHPSGIARLEITRTFELPERLSDDRKTRSKEKTQIQVLTEARLAPDVPRVDLTVSFTNTAEDHRLRMLFPTGSPVADFLSATTFDVAKRTTSLPDSSDWQQEAVATFPSQGWVSANGLTVVAPGHYESEVTPEGVIAFTLVRAVGWLSRLDLRSRKGPAGPSLPTPGAQCLSEISASFSLLPEADPSSARDAEAGFRAVVAGDAPLHPPGVSLLAVEPRSLLLSAVKPSDNGDGLVVRVVNPSDDEVRGRITCGLPLSRVAVVRLDESETGEAEIDGQNVLLTVPPHRILSIMLVTA